MNGSSDGNHFIGVFTLIGFPSKEFFDNFLNFWNSGASPYQIAQVYALRNDPKETFAWLDRAWSNRDSGITFLLYDPFILRYKDDPRFAAFCRKVGLPVPGKPPGRKSA